MYYVHYVHDCFSILGYVAHNRHIYANAWGGGARGYAGKNAWRDSVRGHAGVVVDNSLPKPVDNGNEGLKNHQNIRFASYPIAKVSGARAQGVYPNIDMERILVLTDDYLFDLYDLRDVSGKPRRFEWMLHGAGSHIPDDAWTKSNELDGGKLYERPGAAQVSGQDLSEVQKATPGSAAWRTDFIQDKAVPSDPNKPAKNDAVSKSPCPKPGTMPKSGCAFTC